MSGYKQTEVGVIPEDWNLRDLEVLASVIDGDRGAQYPSANDFSDSGYCLFLNAGNVTSDGFKFVDCAFITREKDALLNKGRLKRDDIVLTTRGTVGNFAHYDATVVFDDVRINSGMVILRNESPSLNTTFLYALLKSYLVCSQIDRFAFGSAQPQLTVKGISKFKVLVPPLPEQCAIAEVLGDADGLIGVLDKLIAKKRDLKQAAMQQLLTGKRRLKGFKGEWEVRTIGRFTDCTSGGTPSTSVAGYWGGTIKWMSSGELNFKIIWDVEGRITEYGLQSSSAKMIPEKCVLVGLAGQGKTRGTVAMNMIPLCTNQSIAAILPSEEFVPEYLYHNLDSRYEELRGLSTGQGGRGGLNLTIIKSIPVPFPTIKEQAAIAAVLSDMDAEIAALEERREKTRALKQGMMQELLTGKTRLI